MHDQHGDAPGDATPTRNDEGPTRANGQPFKDQDSGRLNSAPAEHRSLDADAQRKAAATARARAALAGIALYQLTDDTGRPVYVLVRAHLTRELRDLVNVERWIDSLDVRHG